MPKGHNKKGIFYELQKQSAQSTLIISGSVQVLVCTNEDNSRNYSCNKTDN